MQWHPYEEKGLFKTESVIVTAFWTCHPVGLYCFAKAVHSRAKLRTANSLSIRPFVRPCLVQQLTSIALKLVGSSFVYSQKLWSTCAKRNIFFLSGPPEIWGGIQKCTIVSIGRNLMLQNQLLSSCFCCCAHHWNKWILLLSIIRTFLCK